MMMLVYKILTKIESPKVKGLTVVLIYGLMLSMWITEIVSIIYTTSAAAFSNFYTCYTKNKKCIDGSGILGSTPYIKVLYGNLLND